MNRQLAFFCLLLGLAACGDPASMDTTPCDPAAAQCRYAHDFGITSLLPGQEISSECYSWTLNNQTDLWVNATELSNDGGYHHSNWFYVPDGVFDHEDGKWPCDAIHFDEVGAAILGGVLFAQSTQAKEEVQRLPQDAVVRVPAYSHIIGSVHLLNAANKPVDTGLRLAIDTLPPGRAKVRLTPFRLEYHDLHIPPLLQSTFSATCDLKAAWNGLRTDPFSMSVYYALPHYHVLGSLFRVQIAGGPRDGQTIFELHGGVGEANGKGFDPPIDLSAANGLSFTCGFNNPRDQEVKWGIGDQEMCEMLGFAQSPLAFDSVVAKGAVTTPDGSTNAGACSVSAFKFAN